MKKKTKLMSSNFTPIVGKPELTAPTANEKQRTVVKVPLPLFTYCTTFSQALRLFPLLFIYIYLSVLHSVSTRSL